MKREDLLAPEDYNIVDEIEKYAQNEEKTALIVHHVNGELEKVSYKELIKKQIRLLIYLLITDSAKVMWFSLWSLAQ